MIEEGNRKFGAAAAGKDYAGMAAFHTDDAKLLPPDAPIVSGRKAIEDFWRIAANALGLAGVMLKTIDLEDSWSRSRYCPELTSSRIADMDGLAAGLTRP